MSTSSANMINPQTIPLGSQVGGHQGVLTSEDGSLLFKPALPLELKFYEELNLNDSFKGIRPLLPKFYGTLKLEGLVKADLPVTPEVAAGTPLTEIAEPPNTAVKDEYPTIVLENLSHPFLKPNILDIKLGTVLYDVTASDDKRARMIEAAQNTTSFETGVRLTGFQVYDNTTALPVNTPKSYGKSIKAADLPIGIAKFFPLPSTGSGLPRTTLLPILESVRADVGTLRDSIAQIEMRMVGGSVLIIYEGDWDRAHAGLSVLARKRRATLAQEEEEEPEQEEEEESDSDESNPEPQPVGSPCVVRLIDFAHTRLTPGEGYDEGVLRGLDTVLRLLDGRIFEVKLAEE